MDALIVILIFGAIGWWVFGKKRNTPKTLPPVAHDPAFDPAFKGCEDLGESDRNRSAEILPDSSGVYHFNSSQEAFTFACEHPEQVRTPDRYCLGIVLKCELTDEDVFGGSYVVEILDGTIRRTLSDVVCHEGEITQGDLVLWSPFADDPDDPGQIAATVGPSYSIEKGWTALWLREYDTIDSFNRASQEQLWYEIEEERRHEERFIDKHMQGIEQEVHGYDDPRFVSPSTVNIPESFVEVDSVIEGRENAFRRGQPISALSKEDSDE